MPIVSKPIPRQNRYRNLKTDTEHARCPGFGARPGFGAVSYINPHHIVSYINPHIDLLMNFMKMCFFMNLLQIGAPDL